MIIRNARYKQVLPGVVGYKGNLYTKAYAKGELLFDYTNDEYETQYFTIESLEDGNVITLTIGSGVTSTQMTSISYSVNNGYTWNTTTVDSTTQTINVNLDKGEKVLWKGVGNTTSGTGNTSGSSIFSSTKKHIVYGNIMSLLFGDNFINETSLANKSSRTFGHLFYNNTNIVEAHNLVLPATTLQNNCYQLMFEGCTSLTTAPKLPATTTKQYCYQSMFNNTAIVEAPELPATTLSTRCYYNMFNGCSSLVTAPTLVATTLTDSCYRNMFRGCTSLTEAPELPAATLAQQCYQYMFQNCTSLNYIKCLATDISATDCTTNWVQNVAPTGDFVKNPSMNSWLIDNVNGIPIGWTLHGVATYTVTLTVNDANMGVADGAGTYSAGDQVVIRADAFTGYSFVGWYDGSTLVSSDTTYVFNIYSNISYEARFAQSQQDEYLTKYFTIETLENNNRVILVIPADLTPQDYVSLSYSTDNGTNWTTISIDNTAKNVIVDLPVIGDKVLLKGTGNRLGVGISGCSFNCIKRYKVYGNIMSLLYGDNFTNQTTLTTDLAFSYLFSKQRGGTSYLVDASNLKLPATTLSTGCYLCMFHTCNLLEKGPALPATTLVHGCYRSMFTDCKSLLQAPALPATSLAPYCYTQMFVGCKSLTTAPELPATTLAIACYTEMFGFCYSLTTAPELPATTLADVCYHTMFRYCYSLTTAPELPATTLPISCYERMFEDCYSLTTAPDLIGTTLGQDCYRNMFNRTKIQSLKVYAASSSYPIDFGTINYSNGIYYTKPNATQNILDACPSGWTISKTL